jgi:energy-coupling factor transport system ATP-binding protein
MLPILSVRSLTHKYSPGTPFEKTALKNVSVDIPKGELLVVIGNTGSGKSTFVQHLNGLLRPTGGSVEISGEDIFTSKKTLREARFKVGLVFQYPEYQLFEETVYKDIAFGPRNMGLSETEIDERVRTAAGFAGISERLFERSPFEISGGQKRRAAIAGVIAMRPEVLILDEPTAGLDPAGRDRILQNISEYHSQTGGTVILITHDMEQAARVASRIIVFENGGIVMDGAPDDIFARGDELIAIGLNVPGVTEIALRLRELGVDVPDGVRSAEQLADAVESLKKGGGA